MLVDEEYKPLGHTLRHRFLDMIDRVNEVKKQTQLQVDNPQLRGSLNVRNPYTDPLHYLQAELLKRDRLASESGDVSASEDVRKNRVEMALKVTMAGIAAGIRNTG